MPKLGFNLLNWTAAVSDEHFPHLARLKKIGYDGIEIFTGQQDPAAYQRLGRCLRDLDLGITCVTIVGPEAAVRAKALDRPS